MIDPDYHARTLYEETPRTRTLAPLGPGALWGVVMLAAIAGAGVTVWRAGAASEQRLVSADAEGPLRRDLARLGAERDALALRVAALERGLGEVRLAQRPTEPEATGSIRRPAERAGSSIASKAGLALGIEPSADAAKRRWTTLATRFPGALSRLTPLLRREAGKTPLFELVAGPFATRADAEAACGALAEQGLACDTTDYAGDPIGL
ncbi:SPOR domain-containing protein [Chelatococcus sambhunathii]|uniref:SPOR domain-containing protein n=1 Tax=Chelatococcus sambhunathii TaxID=363953 RepID=A0ABU1DB75_9HYPH|nr:SPOR domain-containing protein [Chelatococcus sambhunathii]MDR4305320.1 SPOR domain-containing protein [Chelatococcus sambhunathii]